MDAQAVPGPWGKQLVWTDIPRPRGLRTDSGYFRDTNGRVLPTLDSYPMIATLTES